MICFHFIIFEPSETTNWKKEDSDNALWFAFISLSLSHQKQLLPRSRKWSARCDLLSFHYLWAIRNNFVCRSGEPPNVVICFHFIIFEPSETTVQLDFRGVVQLWFAFISLSLSHQKQPVIRVLPSRRCCDLLSFHYLWAIRNNLILIIFII